MCTPPSMPTADSRSARSTKTNAAPRAQGCLLGPSVLPDHGIRCIDAVLTDNAKAYLSRDCQAALEGAEHRRIRSYTPRTNGKVERFNRTWSSPGSPDTSDVWRPTPRASAWAVALNDEAFPQLRAHSAVLRDVAVRPARSGGSGCVAAWIRSVGSARALHRQPWPPPPTTRTSSSDTPTVAGASAAAWVNLPVSPRAWGGGRLDDPVRDDKATYTATRPRPSSRLT
jgi:hypothetical protein